MELLPGRVPDFLADEGVGLLRPDDGSYSKTPGKLTSATRSGTALETLIPDKQMKTLETSGALTRHDWHGEWNYTLHPTRR